MNIKKMNIKKMMMISLTATLCCLLSTVQAQKIDRFYIDMPEALQPTLSRQQRLELLEYVKADMGDSTANRFGRQAHVLLMDTLARHIRVQNTDVSRFEMKLFTPAAGDTAIAVIRTVCTPVCNSILQCYDTRWQKRTDIAFRRPRATDWLDEDRIRSDGADEQNLRNMLTADFIELTFDSVGRVKATNHTPEYLDEADREKVLPFLKDEELTVDCMQSTDHRQ